MGRNNKIFEGKYKESGFGSQRRYPNEPLIQFLALNYFKVPKRGGIKILELGCGSGANLWMIAKEGFDTYGMDTSPTALKLCRKMLSFYGVKAKLSEDDFKKLDYPDNFFDAIVDVVSLQHTDIAGHMEAYAEIYRCLKPGGRLFSWHLGNKSISFEKSGGKRIDSLTVDAIKNPDMPLSGNSITCFLSPRSAKKLLKKAGFIDIGIERFTRSYKQMSQTIEYLSIQAQKA